MLNLLSFHPGQKGQYQKYGAAFAESVGSKRGGVAKLVGKVVPESCSENAGEGEWEEVRDSHLNMIVKYYGTVDIFGK